MTEYLSEIIFGSVLGGFAWAFRAWASTIKETSARILQRLEELGREFHDHRLNLAERIMKIETEVKHLSKKKDD